jgi:hypothetical protein
VDRATFDRVQAVMAREQRQKRVRRKTSSPYLGKLFDAAGNRLTPTHSKNRHGRTYRYYIANQLTRGGTGQTQVQRFPAARVDALIGAALLRISASGNSDTGMLLRATLSPHSIELVLPARLLSNVRHNLTSCEDVSADDDNPDLLRWTVPSALQRCKGATHVQAAESDVPKRDPVLINALRRAHRLVERDSAGLPIIKALPQSRYEARLMRLALLSPRIQRDILSGRQAPAMRLEDILMSDIPPCWVHQERVFNGSRLAGRG